MNKRKSIWLGSAWMSTAMTIAITVALTGTALLIPPPAQAVHDEPTPFQIDGNPTQSIGGGNPPVSLLDDDWDNAFGITAPYSTPRAVPDDSGDGDSFANDAANLPGGKESSDFNGTNKDIDEINDGIAGTDNWEYHSAKVTPDKDNITNAYAKAYSVPGFPAGDQPGHPNAVHNHLVIYFGADRFANNGDAALGFWFFQNDVTLGANGQFEGKHAVGDILVQVDFVSGGSSSEIQIFKWVGSGGDFGQLEEIGFGAANGSTVCLPDTAGTAVNEADTACATTNNVARASPWAYVPKSGAANTFPSESFFEGGIDITGLVGEVCFSSFMAETRSSHSETAELKDFALDNFDLCSVNVEKVCFSDGGTTSPVFDSSTELFTTRHTVTITNDGFGAVHQIELLDNSVTATRVCAIATITGGINPTTVPAGGILFQDKDTPVQIAGQLNKSQSITVGLVCATDANPFTNSVTVNTAAADGGAKDVGDTDTESAAVPGDGLAGCTKELLVGLKLLKFCQGDPGTAPDLNTQWSPGDLSVFLDSTNSFKPKVCVDIAISNTQNTQKMVVDSFSDTDLGSLLPVGGLTLEPLGTTGDTYNVSRCYTPTAPDGNQTTPGLVAYSDTVSATGHGKTQPTSVTATPKTATCPLCPTCPSCD
jgi:hypothetical protein